MLSIKTLKRFAIIQVIWLDFILALFQKNSEILIKYWALAAANLIFLGLACDAMLKQQKERGNPLQLFIWFTLKLSCTSFIIYSLFHVQDHDFATLLAGLAGLVVVPLVLATWVSIEDRKRYV